jgi:hypothetical protein
MLPVLRRRGGEDKELDLSEQQANLLMQMSAVQIRLGDHLDIWRS